MMSGTTSTNNDVPAIHAALPVLHSNFWLNLAVLVTAFVAFSKYGVSDRLKLTTLPHFLVPVPALFVVIGNDAIAATTEFKTETETEISSVSCRSWPQNQSASPLLPTTQPLHAIFGSLDFSATSPQEQNPKPKPKPKPIPPQFLADLGLRTSLSARSCLIETRSMQALARWIQRDMAIAKSLSLPAYMPSPIRHVFGAAKLWLSLRPQCHRQPGDANRYNNASARARTVRGRSSCSHTVPLRGSHRLHSSIQKVPIEFPTELPTSQSSKSCSLRKYNWELNGNKTGHVGTLWNFRFKL